MNMHHGSPRPYIKPGDIVRRRKGPVMHVGLVVGEDRILHNLPGRGEHVVSLDEFAQGRSVEVERGSRERAARARLHGRVRDRASYGSAYDLWTNNCEHTVHRVVDGERKSPQLVGWAAGIGIGALTLALTRHPGLAAAGVAFGKQIGERLAKG